MKANLSLQTVLLMTLKEMEAAKPVRSIRTEKILERLSESKGFWELMAKFVDEEISNADLIADLDIERTHAGESIDAEDLEYPDYYDGEENG